MSSPERYPTIATDKIYHHDAYRTEMDATIISHAGEDGIVLDSSIFYATSGGQPSDRGSISCGKAQFDVTDVAEGPDSTIVLRLSGSDIRPPVGAQISQHIDWGRRYGHMRIHTALHLLTVALPFPVTGGQISSEKGRLDFSMPAPLEGKLEIETRLNDFILKDLPVTVEWISAEELANNPGMVKTKLAQPPTAGGQIRLIRIGSSEATVDLQPCGGTHVARTSEIGGVVMGKIENKGRDNRRVTLSLLSAPASEF